MTDDNALSVLWWETDNPNDVLESAKTDFDTIRDGSGRRDRFSIYERIYRNEDLSVEDEALTVKAELASLGVELTEYTRASHNLLAQVTDNIVTRITKSKPRSVYSVVDGNWSIRRNAKYQQKFVDYIAKSKFFPRYARMQVFNGCLLGVGHTKVYRRHGYNDVACMHIHPSDIFVDPTESKLGCIRRMFHREFMSKDRAMRLFADDAESIEKSGVMSMNDYLARGDDDEAHNPILEQVEIVEAWHLPSYPGAGDGKRIIFCEYGLITEEPWVREDFPVLDYRWKERPGNTHTGMSIPEEILGIHLDMNFTLQQVHEGIEVTGSPQWLVPQSAGVSRDELSDLPGASLEYTGNVPPQLVQSQQVAFDLVQYSMEQEARAYRRLGLDSSTPNAPSPGLETGRAVRMDFDARSLAFVNALQNFENLYEDFGSKVIAAGRECYDADNSFSVFVQKNKWTVQEVDWSEVDITDKAQYSVRVQAGSQLSQHPAGRIDDVANLVNMGAVTEQGEIRQLTDLADLEHSNSLATAAREAVEAMVEEMLDDGVEHYPEPYDDLDLCMSIVSAEYLKARTCGAPEDRLILLRAFLDQTSALIQKRDMARQAAEQGAQLPGSAAPPAPDALGQNPTAITGTPQQ